MTIPGVGPVVALTYRATVDVPARFRKSMDSLKVLDPEGLIREADILSATRHVR